MRGFTGTSFTHTTNLFGDYPTLGFDKNGVYVTAGRDCIRARLAVLACGATYAFQRRFGFGLPRTHLHTAQREFRARKLGGVENGIDLLDL